MNKYQVRVTKPHKIIIHMESLQINGSPIPGTEYNTYLDRQPGIFGFKTLKRAKEFVDFGNKECAGAYEMVQV